MSLSELIRNRCFHFIEDSLLSRSSDVSVAWEVVRASYACNYNTQLALRKDLGRQRDARRMYFLYRILTAIGMLFLAPYFALRGHRRGEPASALLERLGIIPLKIAFKVATAAKGGGAIWIHAVSEEKCWQRSRSWQH